LFAGQAFGRLSMKTCGRIRQAGAKRSIFLMLDKHLRCGKIPLQNAEGFTMYCKKCGKDYPKNKKVCPDCKFALVPGSSPASRTQKVNKTVIIVFGVIVVALIAVFLILGL
jgi:hypothetical protein